MPSRLDRYNENENSSRVNKNKDLYQDIKNYEYIDVKEIEPVIKTITLSEIGENEEGKREKRRVEINKSINEIEEEINLPDKEYDINKVIDLAKKNRMVDSLEEKRKLKKDDYNITKSIDIDKIDEIRENRKKQELSVDGEELEELINTIYSNTLKGEIENKELFDDLIDDNAEDSLVTNSNTDINEEISKAMSEYEKEKNEQKQEDNNGLKFDNSFFTKSMEFTNGDLVVDGDEEIDDDFIDRKHPFVKILLFVIVIIIFIVFSYFYFIG